MFTHPSLPIVVSYCYFLLLSYSACKYLYSIWLCCCILMMVQTDQKLNELKKQIYSLLFFVYFSFISSYFEKKKHCLGIYLSYVSFDLTGKIPQSIHYLSSVIKPAGPDHLHHTHARRLLYSHSHTTVSLTLDLKKQ